jgi:integrase
LNVAVRKKLLQANPFCGVEFPVAGRGLFHPHYVAWSPRRHFKSSGHLRNLSTAWRKTLERAGVPYFRIYDLRSTYATRLSAGGVADEWVTQLLRQDDAKVFKKYSQMKLQMKREALEKMNRQANEMSLDSGTATIQ